MEKKKLTVALAVFNEEKNLDDCLSSVSDVADEIIIVDGGSTDKTIEIAKRFSAKIIQTNNPPMFHINKQKALDAAACDWILQLDADEAITPELKKEILQTINYELSTMNGFYIPRRNYFWGHFMKKGGQYPDYVIRLVRNGMAHFPCKSVHEQIAVDGKVGYLKNPMLHYTNRTRADYWRKADTYTSLTAKELHVPKTFYSYFIYTFWKPLTTFLNIYVRHKGFMDGLQGFEFALYSGLHWAGAYKKYIALLFFYCLLFITPVVRAEYVLPYPSFMPGNKVYKISRIVDELKGYWYFGRLAQEKYHLSLADKYLVEAKTLFEYKQYLLAFDALKRSDDHFSKQKNSEAAKTHILVLESLLGQLPDSFEWKPEKDAPTQLPISEKLRKSIEIRQFSL